MAGVGKVGYLDVWLVVCGSHEAAHTYPLSIRPSTLHIYLIICHACIILGILTQTVAWTSMVAVRMG